MKSSPVSVSDRTRTIREKPGCPLPGRDQGSRPSLHARITLRPVMGG